MTSPYIKEVAKLNNTGDSKILEVMSLPAAYTKGSDAMKRSKNHYKRKTISFDTESFNKVVKQIVLLANSGAEVNPENFYPPVKKHRGKSRDLPLVDITLRDALNHRLKIRIAKGGKLAPPSPLFITQKGAPSPNTLQ